MSTTYKIINILNKKWKGGPAQYQLRKNPQIFGNGDIFLIRRQGGHLNGRLRLKIIEEENYDMMGTVTNPTA